MRVIVARSTWDTEAFNDLRSKSVGNMRDHDYCSNRSFGRTHGIYEFLLKQTRKQSENWLLF